MGIRFERDSRRATNGPMIFFSILKDETFEEEIRSAFISGLSFYAYRFPNDTMMSYGSSEGYVEGLDTPGFAIGFFDSEKPIITIPYSGIKSNEAIGSLYTIPERSTTYDEYSREVEEIIKALEGKPASKIVAARVIVNDTVFDIAEKFYELCQRFPEAFVFCFSTPATGCWIGASPELLLESRNGQLRTMALAGTRVKSKEEGVSTVFRTGGDPLYGWDEKNKEEQKIVADYIVDIFRQQGLKVTAEESFTKSAGKVEHICTPIFASLPESSGFSPICSDFRLTELLRSLSPTPALCGNPKDFALEKIRELEHFDRGCYGGFCGPYHSPEEFTFNVIIRCAAVSQHRYGIYVGGGITSRSTVASEWLETQHKIPW